MTYMRDAIAEKIRLIIEMCQERGENMDVMYVFEAIDEIANCGEEDTAYVLMMIRLLTSAYNYAMNEM
jgi:hypothetical protein